MRMKGTKSMFSSDYWVDCDGVPIRQNDIVCSLKEFKIHNPMSELERDMWLSYYATSVHSFDENKGKVIVYDPEDAGFLDYLPSELFHLSEEKQRQLGMIR